MLTRIVKMTFLPENVNDFLAIYHATRKKIAAFKGCRDLALFHDIKDPAVLFTLSHWDTEEDLLAYRNSELFALTWEKVKKMFAAEAEAWSLETAE